MTVFQHVVEYNTKDGIGNDIQGISNLLDDLQKDHKVITLKNNTSISGSSVIESSLSSLEFKSTDTHILHYGSSGYSIPHFLKIPGKKILRFHNLTPESFFYNFCEKETYRNIRDSFQQSIIELQSLCMDSSEIWYDSFYNQESLHELIHFNFPKVKERVLPIFINYKIKKKDVFHTNYNLLYTGRIVPHKKIEDLLFILYFLIKINPDYKLYLVGKRNELFIIYLNHLNTIISELNLSKNVVWLENLSSTDLDNLRENMDFYISMSEHEGFCIPILEAYGYHIPVIAYCKGAVGETMRSGGIKIYQKKFESIAELIHLVNLKPDLKKRISFHQAKELSYYTQKLNLVEYL